jgi:hypothetical protein
MAITFNDVEFSHQANGFSMVKLVNSNDESQEYIGKVSTRRFDDSIVRRKAILTHRWEGTRSADWYPIITFTESESEIKMSFKSTVNCRVFDSEGNIDTVAQNNIIQSEKQRYLTEQGFTES